MFQCRYRSLRSCPKGSLPVPPHRQQIRPSRRKVYLPRTIAEHRLSMKEGGCERDYEREGAYHLASGLDLEKGNGYGRNAKVGWRSECGGLAGVFCSREGKLSVAVSTQRIPSVKRHPCKEDNAYHDTCMTTERDKRVLPSKTFRCVILCLKKPLLGLVSFELTQCPPSDWRGQHGPC